MAEQQTQFVYDNIQLYKSESLGSGSYGGVCKAKCDGLLCAAKIMHPTLFDLRDPGTDSYLRKFWEECHLLSLARHPNVVQYLATCYDRDTQLPVLLMELCDESLTAFLERSPGPLFYHVQLNICLDIALALVYLHSNGLIHRDLTGNNVLMIAGTRAKITDFGMSKLATVNPRMTALTLCPGNQQYMSPEALDEAKSYTAKLDIFSFGVIAIQILTRHFPNPTDRFCTVHDPRYDDEVRRVVPETQRRQAHLQLIPDTHSLKPLAFQCLKKEMQRPSALQLSERLSELKQAPQYTESMHQPQTRDGIQQHQQVPVPKPRRASETQTRITELKRMVEAKDRQLQEKQQIIEAKDRALQIKQLTIEENQRTIATKQHAIENKEREIQQTKCLLTQREQLVKQVQECLDNKKKTISELQQTISHHERERDIDKEQLYQQLQQQLEEQRNLTDVKTREASEHQAHSTQLQRMVEAKDRELQEKQQTFEKYQHALATKQCEIETKERQLQQTQQQLQDSQQFLAHKSSEIQQLEWQLRDQRILIEANTREASHEHQACSTQLQRMVEAKDRQLQENQQTIATKQHAIETKERQLQQTKQQLRDSQQLVEQFQQSLLHKDKTISDLQQTISHHERKKEIQQLKQQDIASSIQPQQLPVTAEKTQTATAVSVHVAQKDMTWREGKKAPEKIMRGAAVVYGNTAYFRPDDTVRVYSYQNTLWHEQWSRLPDNLNEAIGLAVIDGVLTSVGGKCSRGPTDTLLSLTGEGERKKWSEVFPPMPTPRCDTACITIEKALVVAGGYAGGDLATVEVMDINTKQWTSVCPLPQKLRSLSGIVCGEKLYLAGGFSRGSWSKSVFTCSLPDLRQPETFGSWTLTRSNAWKEISSLPVTRSTLASFGGHLLAIGGRDDSRNFTTDVYRYDSHTDSWHVISQMKNKRSRCLAVTLPKHQLIVVGGHTLEVTDSVEILKGK